jgi:DNA-binding XRE family transcriptional regulator
MSKTPSEKRTLEELRKLAKKSRNVVAQEVAVSGERVIYAWERQGVIPDTAHVVALALSLHAPLRTVYESLGFDLSGVPVDDDQTETP